MDLTDSLHLTGDQRRILNMIAAHQLVSTEWILGRDLRVSVPPSQEDEIRSSMASLRPDCVEVTGVDPHERYRLTPIGLLASSVGARASKLIEDLLGLFRRQLDRRATQYTWSDMKAAGVVSNDDEYPLAELVIRTFALLDGGTGGVGPPPTLAYGLPRDIERLRTVVDVGDLLLVRSMQGQSSDPWNTAAAAVQPADAWTERINMLDGPDLKKVFVIHGRNIAAKNAMEQFIRSLKCDPVDFDELASDLGAAFIGEIVRQGMKRAQGIIALFTPDELAFLRPEYCGPKDSPEDKSRWQSRPNVIFEAGMAYGIAPERTILAVLGSQTRLFSDVNGIHLTNLDNTRKSRSQLRQKLIGARCEVDLRTDVWADAARSGDFESCVLPEVSHHSPF